MGYGSGIAVSCGVGCRRGLDPVLLWLWRRLAAIAPIRPLAWEPPYAVGEAQEMAKRQKKKKKKKKEKKNKFADPWQDMLAIATKQALDHLG